MIFADAGGKIIKYCDKQCSLCLMQVHHISSSNCFGDEKDNRKGCFLINEPATAVEYMGLVM